MSLEKLVVIDGKTVDVSTFEFDGVDMKDYPDFCDAFVNYAEFDDGTALTDYQLDVLADVFGNIVYEQLLENISSFA